jgi:uncharacterized SAM-binding protein YcdF (DUF218 family)
MSRLIVVLGYSQAGTTALHPTCAARLRHAQDLVRAEDVVLLSGWSRLAGTRSEAELMTSAWDRGGETELLVDHDATTTLGNAVGAARAMRRLGLEEIVIVTSRWHAPRAVTIFRAALRGSGARLSVSPAPGFSARGAARELIAWPLLVPQLTGAAARGAARRRLRAAPGRSAA